MKVEISELMSVQDRFALEAMKIVMAQRQAMTLAQLARESYDIAAVMIGERERRING